MLIDFIQVTSKILRKNIVFAGKDLVFFKDNILFEHDQFMLFLCKIRNTNKVKFQIIARIYNKDTHTHTQRGGPTST